MRIRISVILVFFALILSGQENFNIDLVAHVPNGESLSDVWGYVAEDGTEYAIIGTRTSTEIYSLADPSAPALVSRITGASSIWRDIKVLGNYIYVVADEGADGILIIDMSQAPDNITSVKVNPVVNGTPINQCHNLFIDTSLQVMFLAGCNINDGVLAFDITTDPNNPRFINTISDLYSHDVFVRDNLVFSSEIFDGQFTIYDIEDINNPVTLGAAKTTTLFTHNAWSSEDNQYLFTTDERANGTIDAYDISDVNNPVRIDAFVPESIRGLGVIPHNTHWMNEYLITSWYDYGIVVTDVSNPKKIVEVGHYLTGATADCWGAYPYLPSGLILASDIINGLYVLQPNYERASYLSGLVTAEDTGNPIFDARVRVRATAELQDKTDPSGEYVVGSLEEGEFEMIVSHPEYVPDTFTVRLVQNETQMVNVVLKKEKIYAQNIKVVSRSTGESIQSVDISIMKDGLEIKGKSDINGELSNSFPGGNYQVVAGKWGYKYAVEEFTFSDDGSYTLMLDVGYEDDFIFDFGWTASAANQNGLWVREVPIGTTFGGQASNPSSDVEDDLGDLCYVTGNGTGGAGQFDVDDGASILVSPPMELASHKGAILSFQPWFFNAGGGGTSPNDTFKIYVSDRLDGGQKVLLAEISENTNGWADPMEFKLSDFITLTDNTHISFEASDDADGHLVEAGVDAFRVILDGTVGIDEELGSDRLWELFPNPVSGSIHLRNASFSGEVNVAVYNATGSLVSQVSLEGAHLMMDAPELPGIYYMNISSEDGHVESKKFTVVE